MSEILSPTKAGEFKPLDHPDIKCGKIGVLLINLGTPDATDYWSMRRYLKEFLSDPRVIEWPKIIWWPILNGIVLSTRPKKSGAAYQSIWNHDMDESPLRTITRSQASKLSRLTETTGKNIVVDWAMRYGNPPISDRIEWLIGQGCDKILAFPLYPQYSATTTATVNDAIFDYLKKKRWQPALRIVPPYYDDEQYIGSLAISIEEHLKSLDWQPEKIITSYHGIPQSYFKAGDPYHCHCFKTTRLLKDRLGWPEDKLLVTFQSRFGPEEWLQPYTDKTVQELARNGTKSIAVINPGFVSDCLETLEEIAGEVGDIFKENGGENFSHIPCLNDSDLGMNVLKNCVERELQGWV